MHDDDETLAGIDLAAWQPPPPPAGTAGAVIARMREPAAVAALDPHERPSRRAFWLGGLALVAGAIVALTAWDVTRPARHGGGEVIADHARHVELNGSSADLDPGAQVQWERDRHRITAHQARGTVRWTIDDDDTLVIDPGGSGSTATIEARGASLRMEVPMNLSDLRLLGASTLTAAAVAVVTVVVYTGHVKATSGGQTVNVIPGAIVELRPEQPPQPPAVGARAADVHELEDQLRQANEKIAALTAELSARTVSHPPQPAPVATRPAPPPRPTEDTASLESPPGTRDACGGIDIDDALKQAANQLSAGFSSAALLLVRKCLACRQDTQMYRMAAMYACAAHDVAAVKEMLSKIPASFQPAIEQRCRVEGLTLGGP